MKYLLFVLLICAGSLHAVHYGNTAMQAKTYKKDRPQYKSYKKPAHQPINSKATADNERVNAYSGIY